MTNDDKDLKPCPFCGDTKYLRVTYQDSKANASITGDKKYWGVFCMEKCGASIDSIYPTREEAIRVWNTRATPQQPSEPLKEFDEVRAKLKEFYADYESCVTPEERRGCLDHWESEFGQPSEKKVLSVEDMKKIMWDLENKLGYQPAYETIAQAIESALPARKEVKWPEKMDEERFYCEDGDIYRGREWNECRDACIKAYEEAIPAQREVRYPDTAYVDKNDGKPGRIEKINYCLGWNHCIDEFKKLNGG